MSDSVVSITHNLCDLFMKPVLPGVGSLEMDSSLSLLEALEHCKQSRVNFTASVRAVYRKMAPHPPVILTNKRDSHPAMDVSVQVTEVYMRM